MAGGGAAAGAAGSALLASALTASGSLAACALGLAESAAIAGNARSRSDANDEASVRASGGAVGAAFLGRGPDSTAPG